MKLLPSLPSAKRLVPFLLVPVAALAFSAAPALAVRTHGFASPAFSGSAFTATAGNVELEEPAPVAVDQSSGDVYLGTVGNVPNNVIDKFTASGAPVMAFGNGGQSNGSGTPAGSFAGRSHEGLGGLAVDDSEDLYVADPGNGVVDKFNSNGVLVASFGDSSPAHNGQLAGLDTPQGSFVPQSVAIGPSDGDLYVGDTAHGVIDVFSAEGAYITQFATIRPDHVAVDASGNVYVANFFEGTVVYNSSGSLDTAFGAGSGKLEANFTRGVAVNPSTGRIFVDEESQIAEYGPTGSLLGDFGASALGGSSQGLAVNDASETVYASAIFGNQLSPFVEGETPPTPTTEAASGETSTTAVLNGTLVAKTPGEKLKYYFEYNSGTSCTAGTKTPLEEGEGKVSQDITGLEPNAQYTFCFVAENAFGPTYGTPQPLTTPGAPPAIESEDFSEPTFSGPTSGARLEAQINPDNELTTYTFEYSTSENGAGALTGTIVKVNGESVFPAEFGNQLASVVLTGLQPGTTYYYRVIAENEQSEKEPHPAEGAVQSFTTVPAVPIASTGAFSALGQSSANVTGTVNPDGAETHYYYQYGPTTAYGQSTATEAPGISAGSVTGAVPAPAILVPLVPGVTYHYRLVAWNEDGTSYGQDQMFTTPAGQSPSVLTGPASGISVNGATISGTIDPEGKETAYRFEYGTSTAYGTQAFGTVLPEQGVQTVTLSLQGLEAGTTYHYRLVVENPGGEAVGQDATFTTPPISDPLVNPAVLPLVRTPDIAFPTGSLENTGAGETKSLTKAQKLTAALKVCKRDKRKAKRAACEKQARRRYGTTKKKGKK
jgi:hypothetical protein